LLPLQPTVGATTALQVALFLQAFCAGIGAGAAEAGTTAPAPCADVPCDAQPDNPAANTTLADSVAIATPILDKLAIGIYPFKKLNDHLNMCSKLNANQPESTTSCLVQISSSCTAQTSATNLDVSWCFLQVLISILQQIKYFEAEYRQCFQIFLSKNLLISDNF
jgi:hypothetical protein